MQKGRTSVMTLKHLTQVLQSLRLDDPLVPRLPYRTRWAEQRRSHYNLELCKFHPILHGKVAAVKLSCGNPEVELDVRKNNGGTPLIYAILYGKVAILKFLYSVDSSRASRLLSKTNAQSDTAPMSLSLALHCGSCELPRNLPQWTGQLCSHPFHCVFCENPAQELDSVSTSMYNRETVYRILCSLSIARTEN